MIEASLFTNASVKYLNYKYDNLERAYAASPVNNLDAFQQRRLIKKSSEV
jgi:hypothetical protein